ncbi:MAG TPA: PaaI family thioesterase [Candidatus Acidoferrales bacterium]|nr:PaaI family thioesterase [Candidatus Acidoferrales bacterium]
MANLDPANPCFGCGGGNARGMKLVFEANESTRRVTGHLRLGPEYQGATGFIHGGIIATVLDEVMSKVSQFTKVHAVTAELNVEYLRPVRVHEDLHAEAFATRQQGRDLYREGEIRNAAGTVLARGRARFVIIDPERYNKKNRASVETDAESRAVETRARS